MTGRRRRAKPKTTATLLAVGAIMMVVVALVAAFAPAGTQPRATAEVTPVPHGAVPPPALSASTSPSSKPPASPSPSPPAQQPVAAAPRTYPAPVTAPAPPRTYPAPAPRTYPPPPRRTYPPPSPAPAPSPPSPKPPPDPGADLPPVIPLTAPLAGVATADVAHWNVMTRSRAQLVVRYVSMARPLAPSFLHGAMRTADGSTVVIEIMPTGPGQPPLSLAQIIAGDRDGWLKALRNQINALHRPVIVSFAPEANGHWYSWKADPAAWVHAYRHVHAIIGFGFASWMWQMSARNAADPATDDFRAWWPGGDVVQYVGLDGYYYRPGDSFESRFGASIRQVETFWGGPVMIAETAISPNVGDGAKMAADMADLFAGVAKYGLLGMTYLNLKPNGGGFFHPDFRLENYPEALAAYRKAVAEQW